MPQVAGLHETRVTNSDSRAKLLLLLEFMDEKTDTHENSIPHYLPKLSLQGRGWGLGLYKQKCVLNTMPPTICLSVQSAKLDKTCHQTGYLT